MPLQYKHNILTMWQNKKRYLYLPRNMKKVSPETHTFFLFQRFMQINKLLTLPEHMSSSPVFSGVRVTRSLVLCVCFADRCLSFCTFSFCHCVVCPSSIYGFWLLLWYLQTLLKFADNVRISFFPHSRLITGFITRLTRRVPPVEQELLTIPEHPSSPPVFGGDRVTRSLVLYVCFVDRCLSFCTFHLAIVLSVPLRYTDYDCPFGIFKLFLCLLHKGKLVTSIYCKLFVIGRSRSSVSIIWLRFSRFLTFNVMILHLVRNIL
jgi:hypothetical protein